MHINSPFRSQSRILRVVRGPVPINDDGRLVTDDDIAAELAITKASVHYHYPLKADLGRALIERYHSVFGQALDAIDRQTHVPYQKLRRYIALYDSVLRKDRMCLCGMLAAEYATLPPAMQHELRRFFEANEVWLARVLEDGRRTGNLAFRGSVRQRAANVMTALEGAMLVARSFNDGKRFRAAGKLILSDLAHMHAETVAT